MTRRLTITTIASFLVLLALVVAGLWVSRYHYNLILDVFPFLASEPEPRIPSTPVVAPQRTLTSDEQAALKVPLSSASAEEKRRHAQEVVKLAQTARELDITGCKPEPLVYQVSLRGDLRIKNNDAIPHAIRYLGLQVDVPAQGSTSVSTSVLFQKPGDYGYGCDNPFAKMGVLMVR